MTGTGKQIPLVGLLGGIGSGKSTVAGLFEKLGCAAIDADAISHEILETQEVRDILRRRFGDGVFAPDGKIDRKALAQIVFGDPEELAFLNSVIHPRALQRVNDVISVMRREGKARAIIIDAPLLVEAGWHKECDVLVFVECDADNRLARLHLRAGLNRQQLDAREKFQISLDRKARLAYYTVNNNADFSALESQVGCVFSKITGVE